MEKRKKDEKENQVKIFKKKSKAFLTATKSPQNCILKTKDQLEETKESFMSKSVMRKSTSGSKKAHKEILEKVNSTSTIHNFRMNNANSRYFTETWANKTQHCKDPKQKKIVKSSLISPERTTINDMFNRPSKDRLSLHSAKKLKNPESAKKDNENKSTMCEELTFKQLQAARKQIQCNIKKTCMKDSISKKDFLRITNQYEKLIDRVAFSEMVDHQNTNQRQNKYLASSYSTDPLPNEYQTFRVNQKVESIYRNKVTICPNLQLKNLKKQKIEDYQDEFMSHYDELSESWKRDLAVQRRY